MHNVTICFSNSRELYGRTVSKLTESDVCHAYIEFDSSDWEVKQAIEIDNRGIIQIPSDVLDNESLLVRKFRYTKDPNALVTGLRECHDLLGAAYDWRGVLVGFVLKIAVKKLFRKQIPNPYNHRDKLFCSEFVVTMLQISGIEDVLWLDPKSVHPGRLMGILEASKDWEEIVS